MQKIILLIVFMFFHIMNIFSQANGFVEAYDSMYQRVRIYYAFNEWKAVDWESINSRIRPKIIDAGNIHDTNAFYLALKEYAASVPDGHISVRGALWDDHKGFARYQQIGNPGI